jgi:hypothetical protein
MELWRGYDGAGVPHHGTSENQRIQRERRTLGFIARIQSLPMLPYCMHSPYRFRNRFQNCFKTLETFWKLLGGGKNDQNPSSMSTPSVLDLVSATPEILGSTTRPASAMAQIDPAPPAELVDPVSALSARAVREPRRCAQRARPMEPKIKIDGEHSTMAADGLLDPAAACAARRASACLS